MAKKKNSLIPWIYLSIGGLLALTAVVALTAGLAGPRFLKTSYPVNTVMEVMQYACEEDYDDCIDDNYYDCMRVAANARTDCVQDADSVCGKYREVGEEAYRACLESYGEQCTLKYDFDIRDCRSNRQVCAEELGECLRDAATPTPYA